MSKRAVFYIGLGARALDLAKNAAEMLANFTPDPIYILTDQPTEWRDDAYLYIHIPQNMASYPFWKSQLPIIAHEYGYESALYLDADTVPRGGLEAYFQPLSQGYDMVICPSQQQDWAVFWHIPTIEQTDTLELLGHRPIQFQAGAFSFRLTDKTQRLFRVWQKEIAAYTGTFDQAAFHRALFFNPVKIWLLGKPFNGGAVLEHRHGAVHNPA